MSNDWKRVAWFAAARRRELGLTQTQVHERGGPSTALVRAVESGNYSANMQATVKRGYESALRWEKHSLDMLLDGDEPVPLPDDAFQPTLANIRPDKDVIDAVSVRVRQDADGVTSYWAETVGRTVDGQPGSRMEMQFWPGEGRRLYAGDMAPIVGHAHREALRATTPDETTEGGDGNDYSHREGSATSTKPADQVSADPAELPAAAKTGLIEEPGEFNT